ncbi:transcriptional regulator, TetR family domain protein [Mycobacterium xenopi 4042]|uniref:Transcriptional regulator, TetR family domain protein n=1 Tax=Mycobacterium xenopi 4042 TaxID=1299334 RepID=X8AHD1_MYCXE|nr:transcriptional regulator, TetR family domain protein [Mycobacterium xenopi 4042]
MTGASAINGDEGTVRSRLIRAADAEITDHGVNEVRMEAIARRAGSRGLPRSGNSATYPKSLSRLRYCDHSGT